MWGLVGLGLGIGLGFAEGRHGPLIAPWLLLGLGYLLVFLAGRRIGRRGGRGATATSIAVSSAAAAAKSESTSAAAVNLFVALPGAGAERWSGLDGASWMPEHLEAKPREVRAAELASAAQLLVDVDDVDDLDPVELIDRRGVVEI